MFVSPSSTMADSREGRVIECSAMLHMGRLLSLLVVQNEQNFMYKITVRLDAAKNALYQKMLQIKVVEH